VFQQAQVLTPSFLSTTPGLRTPSHAAMYWPEFGLGMAIGLTNEKFMFHLIAFFFKITENIQSNYSLNLCSRNMHRFLGFLQKTV